MQITQTEKAIIQNLKDAGCDRHSIDAFLEELQAGREAAGFRRLAAHRKTLLARLHQEQRCIDCLDYLVYQLKKGSKIQLKYPTGLPHAVLPAAEIRVGANGERGIK